MNWNIRILRIIKLLICLQGNPPNNYGQYVGSMSNHNKVYENVIDVLTNKGTIGTNGFEGLKTVEIIDKIYTAAAGKI